MAAVQRRFGGMAATAATVGSGPWSTFVGAVQDLRVTLTEPWYERFNKGLSDLNEWLIKLVGGDRFKKLVDWSAKWADVVDTKVRAAIEWLTGVDWSTEGFKRMLGSIREGIVGVIGAIRAALPDLIQLGRAVIDALAAYARAIVTDLIARFKDQITGELDAVIGALRPMGVGLQQGGLKTALGGDRPWYRPALAGPMWFMRDVPLDLLKGITEVKTGQGVTGLAGVLQRVRSAVTKVADDTKQTNAEAAKAGQGVFDAVQQLNNEVVDIRGQLRHLQTRIKNLGTSKR